MNTLKKLALVASAFMCVAALQAAKVGAPAPDFTLTDTNGQEHSLSDFKGKIVVLEWINHGCPYVKKHYNEGHMQALQGDMTSQDVVWLAICSSAEGKQGFMSNEDWNAKASKKGSQETAVLIDADGKVGKLYGARTTPHMYVVDAEGMLAYNGAIDSIRSTSSADVEKASNYVVAAVASLQAGKPVETAKTKPYGCSIKYASKAY